MGIQIHYRKLLPKIRCEISSQTTPNKNGEQLWYNDDIELDTGSAKKIIPASLLGIQTTENEFAKWISDTNNLEFIKSGSTI